jgi:hypothetical protein
VQLELSSEGRYALRALVYLAWAGERVTADRISTKARTEGFTEGDPHRMMHMRDLDEGIV